MCGIVGIYGLGGRPADRMLVEAMSRQVAHRGPDGEGTYVSGQVGLGHRRLSIIDLSGGAQPLSSSDGRVHITFNGEIYNFVELRQELERRGHVFKTKSDTEVIVCAYQQWGTDCLRRLNGIFAFALWDETQRQLLIARDHLGVKPLYYHSNNNRLIFASEVKALLVDAGCPREVDLESLGSLFTFRYVPSPKTIFKDIRKLQPGHCMLVKDNDMQISQYWRSIPRHRSSSNPERLVHEYRELLRSSIKLQLRSDVPVGLFLSSGVDSAAILSVMRSELSGCINTFTIGFEQGEETNETDDARKVAEQFETVHLDQIIGPTDYETYYERYMWDLEEPVGNESAAAFHFVSRLASDHVKVVLTGQGADEPWAGYHRHLGMKLSETYRRMPKWLRNSVLEPAISALPRNERLKRGVYALGEEDTLLRMAKVYAFFTPDMRQHLFKPTIEQRLDFTNYGAREQLRHLQESVEELDPVSQMLFVDTRASLPDDLLMVNDKTSMANSIESRVPFLDYRLVEFIESIPTNLKLRGFTGKYLHKKSLEEWLPKEVVYRKKKGFDNPVDKWLRREMRSYLEECLLGPSSSLSEYFNLDLIQSLLSTHDSGSQNYMRQLYLLASFEMWHRRFIRSAPWTYRSA